LTSLLLRRDMPGMRAPKFLIRKTSEQVVKRFAKPARISNRIIGDD